MGQSYWSKVLLLMLASQQADLRVLITEDGVSLGTAAWLAYSQNLDAYPQCCQNSHDCQMVRLSSNVLETVRDSATTVRVSFGSILAYKDMQVILAYDKNLNSVTGHAYTAGQMYYISPTSLAERSQAPCFVQSQASSMNLFHKLILRGPGRGLKPALLSPLKGAPSRDCCQGSDICQKVSVDQTLLSRRKPEVTIPLPWRSSQLYNDNLELFSLTYTRPDQCLGYCDIYQFSSSSGSARVLYSGIDAKPQLLLEHTDSSFIAQFCSQDNGYVLTRKRQPMPHPLPTTQPPLAAADLAVPESPAAKSQNNLPSEERGRWWSYGYPYAYRTLELGCEYIDHYCDFNYHVLEDHKIINENNRTEECRQHCSSNANCKHFTWFDARGEIICYLMDDCEQFYGAQCLNANPTVMCASGPKDCSNTTKVVTGCDPPARLTPDYIQWQCNDVKGKVLTAEELRTTVAVGTNCYLRCESWRTKSGERGYLESTCLEQGEWSPTKPHNGDDSLAFPLPNQNPNYPNYPIPTNNASSSVSPLSCTCDKLPLTWEHLGIAYSYDTNVEVGALFQCDEMPSMENETIFLEPDNACTLWCDNRLIARVSCSNGLWTGEPNRGFWCYVSPVAYLSPWGNWSVCDNSTQERTRTCVGTACPRITLKEEQACSSGLASPYCALSANHTMCKYDGTIASTCVGNFEFSGIGETGKKALVDMHNSFRRGQGAKNMKFMVWDEELANISQRWADQCQVYRDEERSLLDGTRTGQNILNSTHSATSNIRTTIEGFLGVTIMTWYNEHQNFSTSDISPYQYNPATAHYTQIVWAETDRLGCGIVVSDTTIHLVCNYAIAGNVVNGTVYEAGTPCGNCPSGYSDCDNLLCKKP